MSRRRLFRLLLISTNILHDIERKYIFNEKLQAAAKDEELEEQSYLLLLHSLSARDSNGNTQAVQNYSPVISQNLKQVRNLFLPSVYKIFIFTNEIRR